MTIFLKPVCPDGASVQPGAIPVHPGAVPVTHGLRQIIPVYHGRVPVLSRFVTVSPWFAPVLLNNLIQP